MYPISVQMPWFSAASLIYGPAGWGLTWHFQSPPKLQYDIATALRWMSSSFQTELHSSSVLWMTCPEAVHPFTSRLKVKAAARETLWIQYPAANKRTCTRADEQTTRIYTKSEGAKTDVSPQRGRVVWRSFVLEQSLTCPAVYRSLCLVGGQIWVASSEDNKGICWDVPSPSSDKGPSILFFHLPRLVQLDDTTSTLVCSRFPTYILHLTQTFPPGCYLCRCQYVIDTEEVTFCGCPLLSPRRVNQKWLMDPTALGYGSLSGGSRYLVEENSDWFACDWVNSRLIDRRYN